MTLDYVAWNVFMVTLIMMGTIFNISLSENCLAPVVENIPEMMIIIYTQKSHSMMRCQRSCAYTKGCENVAFNGGSKTCHLLGTGCGQMPTEHGWKYANKAVLDSAHKCHGNPCGMKSMCSPTELGNLGYHCHQFITTDCKDLLDAGVQKDGVYKINIGGAAEKDVVCDMTTDGGGWTVLQQRRDDTVNFVKNWAEYANGFGNVAVGGNYWLGLENIHQLTENGVNELYVKMTTPNGEDLYAKYSTFFLDDSCKDYTIHVFGHSGTAVDALTYHNGMEFSTYDNNHIPSGCSYTCPVRAGGAWWYKCCYYCNLNGWYLNTTVQVIDQLHTIHGMRWVRPGSVEFWTSMMHTTIMVRRQAN